MTQKKEAASAVFKAGVFPLEPVTVASLGRFGGFLVRLTVMPKWILDQGNRDLPFFPSLRPLQRISGTNILGAAELPEPADFGCARSPRG